MLYNEADIQADCINELTARGWLVLRVNGGAAGRFRSYWLYPFGLSKGFPDLLAMKDGRAVLIEVKKEGGKTSKAQRAAHAMIEARGMQVAVVTSAAAAGAAVAAVGE